MGDNVVDISQRRFEPGSHLITLRLFVLSDGSYRYEMHDMQLTPDIAPEQHFRLWADAAQHAATEMNATATEAEKLANPQDGEEDG